MLVTKFKTFLRRSARQFGIEKIRHASFADLMAHEGIQAVFDVGANEGQYALELREHGYRGRILSFEPISSVFATLQAKASRDPRWDCFQLGVGDRDAEMEIEISAWPVFSSFKTQSGYTKDLFTGAKIERTERVPVVRLDSFLGEHPGLLENAYLKIDTQGFEREVLTGTGALLSRFRGVQLELPLRQLYEGQESWIEMIEWMAGQGFEVAMAKENGFDWRDMRLLELDMLFTRKAA